MRSPEMSLLSNIIGRLYLNATQLGKHSAAMSLVLFLALFLSGAGLQSAAAQVTIGDVSTENAGNSDFDIRRVGTIDISAVLRASEATEKVRWLLDGKRAEFKEEFAQKEAELVLKEQELQSKRDIMSQDAYRNEVQKFQNDVAEIQRQIQFRRQSLDNAFQQAQDKIRQLALKIVTEIANERRLDFVLNKDNVLVFRNKLDITQNVLEVLNERTKNARLELDETPPKSNGG
ncbi:MAG: OmpH family outer membrane protein [Alphaproteobacteria bacterium]|jgi:outer membrane protein|nr:OmpH family outer membrane protein [Alphaproteobacteria bacterium]